MYLTAAQMHKLTKGELMHHLLREYDIKEDLYAQIDALKEALRGQYRRLDETAAQRQGEN